VDPRIRATGQPLSTGRWFVPPTTDSYIPVTLR
jgi:hypothetical protein